LSVGDEPVFDRYEEELLISISTVRSHVQSIYGGLSARSRTQAVARAREVNLL
jgi:ATP/maltotriose-dependent transcriptional regulator MalT